MPDQYTRTRAQLGTPALNVLRRAMWPFLASAASAGSC